MFQRVWHKRRFSFMRDFLPKVDSRILDIGCHSGTFTKEIAKNFSHAEIFGIDIDKKAISYAQKNYPMLNFQVAAAESLPFPKNQFDLILCLEVLEHVLNPDEVLVEARRCLKRGGWLVILVPSENLLFRLIWFFWTKGRGKVWQGAHLHNLGGKYLIDLLKKNNFRIRESTTSHLGMLRAIKARRAQ